jgi:hypothetical protein
MSAVCILAPVVIAAWPAFSAAVAAAAVSLGYQVTSEVLSHQSVNTTTNTVNLEITQSELVTDQLGRDQRIRVSRDGVIITFSRDARGRASLCVTGEGVDEATLRSLGEEMSRAVVQQYVYQRLMDEMRSKGFVVVEEQSEADRTIRLKVRQWEN